MKTCSYCVPASETVLWQGERCRVILANEAGFDGWCRVIWGEHVRELSDLSEVDRNHLMAIVAAVEKVLISELSPVKMNIAALGTAAPHLHVHVIPRFSEDPTFPEAVWIDRRPVQSNFPASDIEARLRLRFASALPRT